MRRTRSEEEERELFCRGRVGAMKDPEGCLRRPGGCCGTGVPPDFSITVKDLAKPHFAIVAMWGEAKTAMSRVF